MRTERASHRVVRKEPNYEPPSPAHVKEVSNAIDANTPLSFHFYSGRLFGALMDRRCVFLTAHTRHFKQQTVALIAYRVNDFIKLTPFYTLSYG